MSVVAIDYGARRIGIAVTWSRELSSPHSILANPGDDEAAAERIADVGRELEAELFILGVPSGRRHDAEAIVARFERIASLIRQKSCTDVVLWDETLSTVAAGELRRERGSSRGRNEAIDAEAAAVILQSWLDHTRRESS